MTSAHDHDHWKNRILRDFRSWIDQFADEESEVRENRPPEPDLRDLLAEFTALRQEMRIQNDEQSKAGRELGQAAERYDSALALLRKREETLDNCASDIARQAENACLLSFLDFNDRMLHGRETAQTISQQRSLLRKPPRGISGLVEGYDRAIDQFQATMEKFKVVKIETVGCLFNGKCMQAIETRHDTSVKDGVVVDELLSGYMRDDDILRVAEVAVNRINLESRKSYERT